MSTNTAIVRSADPQPLPGESVEDIGLVLEVLAQVNSMYEAGALVMLREVGKVVLAQMFGNDASRFAAVEKTHVSYRALAKHRDLRVSASSIWYGVAIQENFRLFGDAAEQLGASQHRRLVHVRDPEARTALAQRALEESLTVEELEAAIKSQGPVVDPDAPKRGRPTLPVPVKRFGQVAHAISELPSLGPDGPERLEPAEAAVLLERARAAHVALGSWIGALEVVSGGAGALES